MCKIIVFLKKKTPTNLMLMVEGGGLGGRNRGRGGMERKRDGEGVEG